MARSGRPLSFLHFLAVGAPVTLVSLLLASAYLLLFQL
jgi:Na+/H+ antiporter NhaD/arsenite permease-like protein